jgi:alpha-aminoadipate/glutamate carrier protein LysW
MMPAAKCPECDEEVFVDADLEQGDFVECEECGASLELVGMDPIELDVRQETPEDDDGFGYEEDGGF